MSLSDAYAAEVADFMTGGAATGPSQWWVALHTASPGTSGANEFSGASSIGYARIQITAWNGTGRVRTNANVITFLNASGAIWQAAAYYGIYDSPSGGSFITPRDNAFSPSVSISAGGGTLVFNSGQIDLAVG